VFCGFLVFFPGTGLKSPINSTAVVGPCLGPVGLEDVTDLDGTAAAKTAGCASAEDCFRVGQDYLRGSPGLAIAPLEKSVALDTGNVPALRALASAYIHQYDSLAFGKPLSPEVYCRAETVCRMAISFAPHDPEALLLLGEIIDDQLLWHYRGDADAVRPIERAIGSRPNWPEAYCELSRAFRLLGRHQDAIDAYETEAALRNEDEAVGRAKAGPLQLEARKSHQIGDLLTMADMCENHGKHAEALHYLERAMDLDPKGTLPHFWAGKIYLNLGRSQAAKREQEAISEICKSGDDFFVTQCQGYAKSLLDALNMHSEPIQ
jgi:tetratricopeptide (TPR) repeat protein